MKRSNLWSDETLGFEVKILIILSWSWNFPSYAAWRKQNDSVKVVRDPSQHKYLLASTWKLNKMPLLCICTSIISLSHSQNHESIFSWGNKYPSEFSESNRSPGRKHNQTLPRHRGAAVQNRNDESFSRWGYNNIPQMTPRQRKHFCFSQDKVKIKCLQLLVPPVT